MMATQRIATTPRTPRKRTAPAPETGAAAPPPTSTAPIKLYTNRHAEVEMVPLFSIDDVDYLIPAKPNALMALRYLEKVKASGGSQDVAMAGLLEDLLGPEAYRGLLEFTGHMTPEELAELFQAAQNAVAGLVEVPKGD